MKQSDRVKRDLCTKCIQLNWKLGEGGEGFTMEQSDRVEIDLCT